MRSRALASPDTSSEADGCSFIVCALPDREGRVLGRASSPTADGARWLCRLEHLSPPADPAASIRLSSRDDRYGATLHPAAADELRAASPGLSAPAPRVTFLGRVRRDLLREYSSRWCVGALPSTRPADLSRAMAVAAGCRLPGWRGYVELSRPAWWNFSSGHGPRLRLRIARLDPTFRSLAHGARGREGSAYPGRGPGAAGPALRRVIA